VAEVFYQPVVAVNTWPGDSPSVYGEIHATSEAEYVEGLHAHEGCLYMMLHVGGLRIVDLY